MPPPAKRENLLLNLAFNIAIPSLILAKASTPEQAVLETTLGTCVTDLAASGIEPPALVVLGEVVRLRQGLDWLGALSGRVLNSDPLGTRHHSEAG